MHLLGARLPDPTLRLHQIPSGIPASLPQGWGGLPPQTETWDPEDPGFGFLACAVEVIVPASWAPEVKLFRVY